MSDDLSELKKLSKPELAVTLANLVRSCFLPEDGKWTIGAGRDCIEVLLMAARMVFPTQGDIDHLVCKQAGVIGDVESDIRDVAQDVAVEVERAND